MSQIENSYYNRVQRLKSGEFNIQNLQKQVGTWIYSRPAVIEVDQDITILAGKTLPSEIDETLEETEKLGSSSYDGRAVGIEAMDTGFILMASTLSNQVGLDPYRILPYVNGTGNRSDIFDVMTELGTNIEAKTYERDVHRFLIHYVSFLAGLPETFKLEPVMADVVEKNSKNYPAELFTGVHPFSGEKLSPEEKVEQFKHARRCLKLIRMVHRQVLNHKDRDYGLEDADWKPYAKYMIDFEHSDAHFGRLALEVCQDLHLTAAQTEHVFSTFSLNATVQMNNRKAA